MGFVFEDDSVKQGAHNIFFGGVEAAGGLELEAEVLVGGARLSMKTTDPH